LANQDKDIRKIKKIYQNNFDNCVITNLSDPREPILNRKVYIKFAEDLIISKISVDTIKIYFLFRLLQGDLVINKVITFLERLNHKTNANINNFLKLFSLPSLPQENKPKDTKDLFNCLTNEKMATNCNSDFQEMIKLTGNFNPRSLAFYRGYKILLELNKDNYFRNTDIDSKSQSKITNKHPITSSFKNFSFRERSKNWNDIKFYIHPESLRDSNEIPLFYYDKLFDYLESDKECEYVELPKEKDEDIKGINPSKCKAVKIADSTRLKTVRPNNFPFEIMANGDRYTLMAHFTVLGKVYYNCLGWALGIEEFINNDIWINYPKESASITSLAGLKLLILQYAIALRNSDEFSNHDKSDLYYSGSDSGSKSYYTSKLMSNSLIAEVNINGISEKLNNSFFKLPTTNEKEFFDSKCRADDGNEIEEEMNIQDGTIIFYGGLDEEGGENKLMHAARYIKHLRSWTSKMGELPLITHGLHHLDGDINAYGRPVFLYCPNPLSSDDIANDDSNFIL
jgi:hypothetical protein